MQRKIIKQGHNTLTITLPSEWAKRFNLAAGKEIDMIERDNGLFVSVEKNGEYKKAEFNIDGKNIPTLWKYFMAVYREGYDELLVRFTPETSVENPYKFFSQHKLDARYKKEREKRTVQEAIRSFISRFIGFEIIEHGKDFVLVKEMGEPTTREFDNSLRRVFLLIQQMAEETLNAIKTNNAKILSHTHDVDINLDKFHDYCIRILNKTGNKEPKKTSLLFSTLYLLELIGDEFKNISHHFLYDFPNSKLSNMEKVGEEIKEMLDEFYNLFYKFDEKKINRISEIDQKIHFNIADFYKKASQDEAEVFHHLRIIPRYVNALVELRIEMEY